ncbi:MAG: LysR family transcriptional regulator [Desulfobacterales bacterium]|nr:LysR family transcriptional regulator [Desulfobacterales bacterium]
MELNWIEDFLTLCQEQNFTRAADMRGITQPAFSRRFQRLEEWLGVTLIQRGVRPMALTKEGETFRVRAVRLREDMLDARRAVQSLASHYDTPCRLYTTNTLAVGFYPRWVKNAVPANRSLVVASITACLEALRAGRADMALIPRFSGEPTPGDLSAETVGQEKLALVALPDVAKQVGIKNSKLEGPVLMYTPRTGYGTEISGMMASIGVSLAQAPMCESASAEALAAQVQEGMGAAWIPQSLVGDDWVECEVPDALISRSDIVLLRR